LAALSTLTPDRTVLRAARLSKRFAGNVTALDAVDLELTAGQLVALVGGNGAGKTTLLKLITGQLSPDAGSLTVFGNEPKQAKQAMRRKLSSVSQRPALDPEMTVSETLQLFAILYELPASRLSAVITDAVQRFGLQSILARRVNACSGGMQQRLHLACAMLHDAEFMLLDEPTNNLDTEGRELLWQLLREKSRGGVTVLLSTHELAAVESFADRVLVMHHGRILAEARPQDLIRTHGVPILELRFTQAFNEDKLKQSLRALAVAGEVVVREASAVFAFSGEAAEEQHIQQQLSAAGMTVSSATRHLPDLASACWSLTKDWADRPNVQSRGTGHGRPMGGKRGRKR